MLTALVSTLLTPLLVPSRDRLLLSGGIPIRVLSSTHLVCLHIVCS